MVYVLALLSALANALTSILQRIGVEDAPEESTLRLSLLTHALKRGVWLLGFAFMVASFLMQAVALHIGDLSQVQPILTIELPFLVLLLATWFRFHIGPREWLGCLAAAGGLAGFLFFAQPVGGEMVPTGHDWIVAGSVCGGVVVLTVLLALRGPRWWRAAMFGAAGAVGFAFTASLIKTVGDYVATDWTQIFGHWETYALALCGVASLFLAQNAFHAGPIAASQTALVLVDPLASLALGIGLYGDNLRTSGVYGPLEAISLVIMFVGAITISHSPLVSGMKGDDQQYSEMLSLRSRSKRLVEAVQDHLPADVIEHLPADVIEHLPADVVDHLPSGIAAGPGVREPALMIRRLQAELIDGAGAVLGEGPSWDARTGELVWVDILSGSVRLHDGDGRHRTTFTVGGHVGSALPAEDGGWLLATADGFAHLDRDGSVQPLLEVDSRSEIRFNDAKCDPWGRALAGTMRYDEMPGSATLYRLEGAPGRGPGSPVTLTARPLLEGIGLSNGLGWSADARTFYFIDTLARSVASHPYHPDDDHLGPRSEIVAVDPAAGLPDGMCVDATGSLWVALYGGGAVHRYTPDGVLDTVVSLPVPCPTSVAFGGAGGDRLFITTGGGWGRPNSSGAGGLWSVDPGTTGPPATPWRAPDGSVGSHP